MMLSVAMLHTSGWWDGRCVTNLKVFGKQLRHNDVLFGHFHEGTEETHKHTSARTAGVLTEIRMEHLLNIRQEHYP